MTHLKKQLPEELMQRTMQYKESDIESDPRGSSHRLCTRDLSNRCATYQVRAL